MAATIELENAGKVYGGHVALHPTTLHFEQGLTTVLIGPSGCGKSTLLRMMMGLIKPSSGTIKIDGQALTAENLLALRRRLGYVIQDGGLFPHLTAQQNILLMSRHLKRLSLSANRRLEELCALTHFPHEALDRYPGELSGGQRQRVSLMRALALSPDVLLLDEPLAALDPIVRSSLQTELKQIVQELGQTVVFVTHDMAEAAYLGDTIVLLNNGAVVQQGVLADLRGNPATPFVTEFFNAQRTLVQL